MHPMPIDRQEVIRLLQLHSCSDEGEMAMTRQTVLFVQSEIDCFRRDNLTGHVTASAWVIDPVAQRVVLTHHARLDRWFQPGGHIEDRDASLIDAALREAKEESGIPSIVAAGSEIFDVDIHAIPANKQTHEHLHHDIRFLFHASSAQNTQISDESHDVRWVPFDEVIALSAEPSLLRMLMKSMR
jgi:8-oxo-dGTP pyrophosphatase MutT (NUDIX family)